MATKKVTKKKHCSCCGTEKPLSDFYMSKSPLHALDGKTPICKDCVIKSSLDEDTNEIDETKFKNILRSWHLVRSLHANRWGNSANSG